jgi:hypothetical protein
VYILEEQYACFLAGEEMVEVVHTLSQAIPKELLLLDVFPAFKEIVSDSSSGQCGQAGESMTLSWFRCLFKAIHLVRSWVSRLACALVHGCSSLRYAAEAPAGLNLDSH